MNRRGSSTRSRQLRMLLVLIATIFANGCAETFGDRVRDHRNCIGAAQIEPEKVDLCIRDTNGHRDRVDLCLIDQMVPDSRIELLNECVETYAQRANY